MPPNLSIAVCMSAATVGSSVTSKAHPIASPPASRIRAAADAARSAERSPMMTCAPSLATRSAVPAPLLANRPSQIGVVVAA
jgi:hypothetical protein